MVTTIKNTEADSAARLFQAKRFALWIGIAGMMMVFTSLTSAYIVRKAAGNWLEFKLPDIFFYNALLAMASSVVLQASYAAFKRGKFALYKSLLALTLLMGVAFLVGQYAGWMQLTDMGIFLQGNPSGSFVFVLSGLHALHLLVGLTSLSVALFQALSLPDRLTERRKFRFGLTLTFWHFLTFLWVYLMALWMYLA
ncbi:MAG TPA: cytochrome oxidase subunit III [Phaeodactylibacter sp.]|nr:cytochrome oxidase subunit III [Phaeodactylibacter sp.]